MNAVGKRKIFAGNRKLGHTLTELPVSEIQQYLEIGHGLLPYPYFSSFMIRESELALLYDWRFTANQFVLTRPVRLTTSNFIFQLNTCGYSSYVTSPLMRGWVCHLQLLLVLASAVILSSESRGTHNHVLLSQFQDSPNLEGQVPVFISPKG
jgi:hypothetical protein